MATSKLLGTTTIKLNDVSTVKFRDNTTASDWQVAVGTTFNQTVTFVETGTSCPSEFGIDAWLTTEYPPSNYSPGYRIRVNTFTEELVSCGVTYWIAV